MAPFPLFANRRAGEQLCVDFPAIRRYDRLRYGRIYLYLQKHIARYLAQPAILRDPKVRALLQEVCREVKELDSTSSHPRISP